MRIKVFAKNANVEADRPIQKVSQFRAEQLVGDDQARWLDENDIGKGIQLQGARSTHKVEARGSREQNGPLTARESELNAEHFGSGGNVGSLIRQYEHRLEKHLLEGRKGTPRGCNVIAARVKTILSDPSRPSA